MSSLWLDTAQHPRSTGYETGSRWDDIVIGAGLTGLVTAVLLAGAGRRVLVLEARTVGAVTTGHTTGKVSLLQGTRLSSIVRNHGNRVAAAYVTGNRAAQDWIDQFCAGRQVAVERRDAWSYASTPDGGRLVRRECETAQRLDLPVEWTESDELPYRTFGAARLADQLQLDPVPLLIALAAELELLGGTLVEHERAHDVHVSGAVAAVTTSSGWVSAEHVVLATGVPFLDRGLYFAKVRPERSYAAAYRVSGPLPRGMYLSVDSPTRSLRTAGRLDEELLLVGGNGHPVGRAPRPPSELLADLHRWTGRHFPGAEPTHAWSAQDYRSANSVPFVGRLPRGQGQVQLATGFGKWGLTNGPMAALMISSEILGTSPGWAQVLQTRVSRPSALMPGIGFNAEVAAAGVTGWLRAETSRVDALSSPSEGVGLVGSRRGRPVAVSTVQDRTCAVSAVCTHLGGVVTWNDQEQSWDCPLHGSRFAADGTVLEGPATEPLDDLE